MTRFTFLHLKNALLLANIISNVIGVSVVHMMVRHPFSPSSQGLMQLSAHIGRIFMPCAFVLPIVLTLHYERSIRQFLDRKYHEEEMPEELATKARRRLLNEPFFLIALDLGIWLAAALLYSTVFWVYGADQGTITFTFFTSIYTGLTTTTIAFFVFEFLLQKRLAPQFFPNGGLYTTPNTIRIRIRTRLIAVLFACNLIPFIAILSQTLAVSDPEGTSLQAFEGMRSAVFTRSTIFMSVGIWLTILVSGNLTRPLHEIVRVLRSVRNGHFDQRVRVTSNDEIGYTGDMINEMSEGLQERDFIKETFGRYVAQEIRDEVLSRRIPLDGEIRDVSILFSDLRNFTPLTESNEPKLVVRILNSYFKEMAGAIQDQGGLILQFIGDEIYAVFGAPIFRPDHPARAFRAGLEMSRRLARLNKDFAEKGWPTLRHGIGIHTGEAVAANIGSPDRLSYLLVGDTVNLASRLQSLTREVGTEIIVSATTQARLAELELDTAKLKPLPPTRVKGRSQPVEIFALG